MTLLAHFPAGATPRPEQARLLARLADAIAEADDDPRAPRVFFVEAPPGVGKSHVAMTLARWSGDAYLLTSQKLLQDQYEREFGDELQIVKGRDNYRCELYTGEARITTSHGMCRRPRGPACQCPYARAKAAALAGPVFCTNTAYFLTMRQWQREQLRRRRLLVIDEGHTLEAQLARVFTVGFTPEQMREWFGAPLPHRDTADEYRELVLEHVVRMEERAQELDRVLESRRPPGDDEQFLQMPLSREERDLVSRRDALESALARLRFFVDTEDTEWVVRHPPGPTGPLELVPLSVAPMARDLLWDAAEITVLSSAYFGHAAVVAEYFGLAEEGVRTLACDSPFPTAQRRIEYRPVGALSKATLAALEPALFAQVAAILDAHADDKGLIHVASYAAGRRLAQHLAERAPREARRLVIVDSPDGRGRALDQHRASPLPTVLLAPGLREGVDLPDDFLRFQIITKMPYPDLGDPWTATRQARDPRWYALETAKALVQAYGRSCRHADDHGVTYVLDGQFARFLQRYRPLLPPWFLEAAEAALARTISPEP